MSIPVNATSAASAPEPGNAAPPAVKAKAELNVAIVQASLSVSISSGDDPLALVYKSAITSINEALKADFGDDAIQNAVSQDNSPEGTAERIVSLTTAFYQAFKQQHIGEEEDVILDKFLKSIRGGIEQGFGEARDILQGLNVLNGDVAGNIDKTYDLVQKGLDQFAASQQAPEQEAA